MRGLRRRAAAAMLFVAVMSAAPMAVVTVVTPAVSGAACPVGQVPSSDGGCVPYCPPGSLLDTQTGACVGAPPPPPPPPPPPACNGDITPYFSVCAGIPGPFGIVNIGACI